MMLQDKIRISPRITVWQNNRAILKLAFCFVMILLLSVEARSQNFGFSASDVVIARNGSAARTGEKGLLVVQKDGPKWVAQLTLGDRPGPVVRLSSLKLLNTERGECVRGISNDFNFEINQRQLTITTSNYAIVFPQESLKADFKQQLTSLKAKLGASAPSRSNSQRSDSAQAGVSRKPLLPTSGNLTPVTFAAHPFGFMPQGPMPQAEVCGYLRQAGWPSKPYSSSLMCVISCTAFEIPFKMYGKYVTMMSMAWNDGKNTSYDMNISDFKRNWTKEDAVRLAEKIYNELIAAGYRATEVRLSYNKHYVEKAVTDGRVYIQINAAEYSKRESWDAFAVEMEVRYL